MPYSNRDSIVVSWIAFAFLILAITAWISWCVSSDLTEQSVRAEKTAEYHDNYAEDRIDEKCLSLEPMPMRDCIHEEIEAARDHERSEQDLDAQQDMARFTKIMGWTAIAGIVLGLFSIGVIYFTFREMRRTNEILRIDQRPWITLRWKVACEFIERDNGYYLKWFYDFENKGKSPAFNVRVSFGVYRHDWKYVGAGSQATPVQTQKAIRTKSIGRKVLFPGETSAHIRHPHWSSAGRIDGEDSGTIFLCVSIAYELDSSGGKTGYETRVLVINRDKNMQGPFADRAQDVTEYQDIK